ncbi:MAG: hypothetical protein RSC47_05040 [Raoultibacter sp.]
MSEISQETEHIAQQVMGDEAKLTPLAENLSGSSRRTRQVSAAVFAVVSREKPELLVGHSAALVDALNRPEAQTRWECLDALTALVDLDSRSCDKAIIGAETALFDEDSGPVRLAAMRFLCRLGATTENRSEKVWSLLDEAIQCYHGDPEFQDMLVAVISFSEGKLSEKVKQELTARMTFDATNGKGTLGRRAAQIVANLK